MSYKGLTVIDADSYIREYVDVARTYWENSDPEFRDVFEKLSSAVTQCRSRKAAFSSKQTKISKVVTLTAKRDQNANGIAARLSAR